MLLGLTRNKSKSSGFSQELTKDILKENPAVENATVKENIMNSLDNPNRSLKSSNGTSETLGQMENISTNTPNK